MKNQIVGQLTTEQYGHFRNNADKYILDIIDVNWHELSRYFEIRIKPEHKSRNIGSNVADYVTGFIAGLRAFRG